MSKYKSFDTNTNRLALGETASQFGQFGQVARAVFPSELRPAPVGTDAALGVYVRVARGLKSPPRDYLPTHVHPDIRHMFFDWPVKTDSFPNGNALYDAYIYIKAPIEQILEDENGNAIIFYLIDDGYTVEIVWQNGFKPSCVYGNMPQRRDPEPIKYMVEWIAPVQPRSYAHRPACRFLQLPYTRTVKRFEVRV